MAPHNTMSELSERDISRDEAAKQRRNALKRREKGYLGGYALAHSGFARGPSEARVERQVAKGWPARPGASSSVCEGLAISQAIKESIKELTILEKRVATRPVEGRMEASVIIFSDSKAVLGATKTGKFPKIMRHTGHAIIEFSEQLSERFRGPRSRLKVNLVVQWIPGLTVAHLGLLCCYRSRSYHHATCRRPNYNQRFLSRTTSSLAAEGRPVASSAGHCHADTPLHGLADRLSRKCREVGNAAEMPRARANVDEEAQATLAKGLGCMTCIRHDTKHAFLDGSVAVQIRCLMPLGKKKKCVRCRKLKDNCEDAVVLMIGDAADAEYWDGNANQWVCQWDNQRPGMSGNDQPPS
ncbi:hypothetical protein QBC45DRAFT_456879 [Copromyces sp. CBS 386.78]|nr:hypothetical protein QBC45DRAFT_456879 [Copromyces sp. CBS 386.78]